MSPCDTHCPHPVTPSTSRLSWQCAVPCRTLIPAVPGAGTLTCFISFWDGGSLVRLGQKNIIQLILSLIYRAASNENMLSSSQLFQLKKSTFKKPPKLYISISDKKHLDGIFSLKLTFFLEKGKSTGEEPHGQTEVSLPPSVSISHSLCSTSP